MGCLPSDVPVFPVAGNTIAKRVDAEGLQAVVYSMPLLHDRDDSIAWADWHRKAGIPYHPARSELVIPDPNVRVQAVIDGQGMALNDRLVADELAAGRLTRVSQVALCNYGYYLVYPKDALHREEVIAFRDWIMGEARANPPV